MESKFSIKDAVWMLDFSTNYIWLKDKRCYNISTNRFIKQTKCGGSIGYVIDGKFYSNTKLRPYLIKHKIQEPTIKHNWLKQHTCKAIVFSDDIIFY